MVALWNLGWNLGSTLDSGFRRMEFGEKTKKIFFSFKRKTFRPSILGKHEFIKLGTNFLGEVNCSLQPPKKIMDYIHLDVEKSL